MKNIILIFLLFVIPISGQYTISIDGDPSDWDNNDGGYSGSQLSIHGTGYFNGQWIYKGESGDQRTDIGNNLDNDLTEIRFGRDATFLYLLVKMQNIENGGDYIHLCIAIDSDLNNLDGSLNWLGDDSQTSIGSAGQYGERNITIHDISASLGTNLQFELFADDGSFWYSPPTSGYQISVNTSNEVLEARITLADLNITASSIINISLASFVNSNSGYNNDVDGTQDLFSSDAIDVMTPGASSGTNAWFRDLSDGNVGYSALIDLNQTSLPVELNSFIAAAIGSNVKLTWQTATEINNYGFEIERSVISNGVRNLSWEKIGFVNGNGNSSSPKSYSFVDDKLIAEKYSYRLKQIDNDGQFEYSKTLDVDLNGVKEYKLTQNYPNPFNPTTTIQFQIPQAGMVKLTLYNILGQAVRTLVNEFKESGVHTINLDASDLNSGVYVYKVESGSFTQTKKMTLVK